MPRVYKGLIDVHQSLLMHHQPSLIKLAQQYCFSKCLLLNPTFMFWKDIVGVTAKQRCTHLKRRADLYGYWVIFRLGSLTLVKNNKVKFFL